MWMLLTQSDGIVQYYWFDSHTYINTYDVPLSLRGRLDEESYCHLIPKLIKILPGTTGRILLITKRISKMIMEKSLTD